MPTDFGVSTKNSFLALAEDTEGDKKAPPQAERKKVDKRDKPARGGAARGGGAGRGGGAAPAKKTDRRKGPGGPPKTEKRHGAGSHNWGDPQQDVNFPSQTEPATPVGFEVEVGADGKTADGKTADGKTADGKEKEIEGIGLDEYRLKQEAARPKGDAKSERKPDNSNRDLKAASAFVAAKDEPLFDIEATEVKSKAPAKGKKAAAVTHDPAPKTKRTAKLSVSDFWKKNPAPEPERHERQDRSFERQDRFEQQSFDQPADGAAPAGEDRFQNQGSRDAPQGDNSGRGRGGRGRGGRGRGRGRGGPRDGGDGGDFRGGEFRSGGDYRGGRGGGEFRPRGRGGEFRPRGRGGEFRPRDGGEFRPREGGEFRPREGGEFRPRGGSRGGPRGGPRGGGAPRGGPRGAGGPRGGGRGRGRQHDGEGGGFADEDNFPKLA